VDEKYMEYLACLNLTSYHYKILLLLNVRPYNQAAIADILKSQRQNIFRSIKKLEAKGLIEVDRLEGRNKFYKVIRVFTKSEKVL
jgi:DNA-binding MarR family transcriptional regulator